MITPMIIPHSREAPMIKSEWLAEFAEALKATRKPRDLTQQELADLFAMKLSLSAGGSRWPRVRSARLCVARRELCRAFAIVGGWVCRVQANLSGTKTAGYGARVGEQISRADLASAAEQLRRVLATVPADPDHCAYLRGAADTLAMLAAFADDSGKCPETKVSGHGQHVTTDETFPQDG
jgi:CelD/BcsL family acetyltransferase involved in cellulose biosynthesis